MDKVYFSLKDDPIFRLQGSGHLLDWGNAKHLGKSTH